MLITKLWFAAVLTLVAGPLGELLLSEAFAQGRKRPPRPPEGTIYFEVGNKDVYAMNPDGTNVKLVISAESLRRYGLKQVVPSRHVYGTDTFFDRWWIGIRNFERDEMVGLVRREVVVFMMITTQDGELAETQLTDAFYRGFNPCATRCRAAWGPGDRFLSYKAYEFALDEVGNPGWIADHLVRLDVSGLAILEMMMAEGNFLLDSDSDEWSVAATLRQGYNTGFHRHSWNDDGTAVAFTARLEPSTHRMDLSVQWQDEYPAPRTIWARNPGRKLSTPDWAPDGSQIAIGTENGVVWLVNPDGGNHTALFDHDGNTFYDSAAWSPDSRQLVARRSQRVDQAEQHHDTIVRVRRDGTGLTEIPTGWPSTVAKAPLAWVSNDWPDGP